MGPVWTCLLSLLCMVPSGLGDDGDTGGAGRCRNPGITAAYVIYGSKRFYDVGQYLEFYCKTGYRAVIKGITCVSAGQWSPSYWCVELCKLSSISNIKIVRPQQDYYSNGYLVFLQCKSGYYPSPLKVYCRNNGDRDVLEPTPVCVEVKVNKTEVTATGLSLTYICTPDECQSLGRADITTCMYRTDEDKRIIRCADGKHVTFSGLEPLTRYQILTYRTVWHIIQNTYITTAESAPLPTDILQTTTMEDSTIVWRLSSSQGPITSSELNMAGRRDYNSSFSPNITERFPPNVTQHKVSLQPGTNYTSSPQGVPSVGGGEYNVTTMETPLGADILRTPTMEDSTIVWRLSNDLGNITGSELNMAGRRDYNSSFSLNVTERFPPNVTQHKASLQPGTNYTSSPQGVPSERGGEYNVTTMETPLGGLL